MGVPTEQLTRVSAASTIRESQGYFRRAKVGDLKASSLFARLIAYDLNPTGKGSDFGCLSKSPGEQQVDGFAEDAICWTDDANNLQNVLDIIARAGQQPPYTSSNQPPSLTTQEKPRRENNKWVKPAPLTADQLDYLLGGAVPAPPSGCVFPPQDESHAFGTALNTKYKTDRHAPLIGTDGDGVALYVNLKGMTVWLQDYLRLRTAGKSHSDAQAEVFHTIDQVPLS